MPNENEVGKVHEQCCRSAKSIEPGGWGEFSVVFKAAVEVAGVKASMDGSMPFSLIALYESPHRDVATKASLDVQSSDMLGIPV